jgi:hypothetical protein
MFVTGCSGGGVLTAWTVGKTDRFAAASANCPVIDWISFVGTTDGATWYYNFEKLPWEDPSEHLRRSPLTYVGNVKTPTMLMTGVQDLRTPMPQTEQFYSALKLLKVPTAMVRFNNECSTAPRPRRRTSCARSSYLRRSPTGSTGTSGRPTARRSSSRPRSEHVAGTHRCFRGQHLGEIGRWRREGSVSRHVARVGDPEAKLRARVGSHEVSRRSAADFELSPQRGGGGLGVAADHDMPLVLHRQLYAGVVETPGTRRAVVVGPGSETPVRREAVERPAGRIAGFHVHAAILIG